MKDYAHLLADDPDVGGARGGVLGQGRATSRAARRARAAGAAPSAPAARRLPRRLPPRPRPGRPRAAARRCCAGSPSSSCSSPPTGSSAAARPASTTSCSRRPPPSSARARRANLVATGADVVAAGQPRLRAADRRAPRRPRAPDLPPDDPAGPLDQRNPPMKLDVAPTREEQLQEILSRRGARLRRRAARPLRRAPRASCSPRGASGPPSSRAAGRSTSSPRRARSARATGRSPRRRATTSTGAWRSPARPTASWSSTRSTPAPAGFMADFEDANSPTWANQVGGHVNLVDAIEGTIEYTSSEGKEYRLDDEIATLLVRPRGWHLPEKHLQLDGEPASGALVDFGLHVFHGGRRLAAQRPRRVLLPAQARAPPRGAAVERRVRVRRGPLRPRARHAARDGADRDAARRVPDGRDPLRAARALARPQRRPLGLHLLDDQVLPRPARSSCCPTATT